MAGYGSFCVDESSVDSPGASKSGAPICGHQGALDLTLRQGSDGGEGNSIRQQDITDLALLQKCRKAKLCSGFSLPCTPRSTQGDPGLSLSCVFSSRPAGAAGCVGNDNIALNMATNTELMIAGYVPQSADFGLSIVPYSEPANSECVCVNAEIACSCTPHTNPVPTGSSTHNASPSVIFRPDLERSRHDNSTMNNPYRQPNMAGSSLNSSAHRHVYDPCLAQPGNAHQGPDDAFLGNPVSHSRANGEQSFPASVPRYGTKNKRDTEGFPLPGSLARTFDSSEIDKIAKAIVRVNEFGSSTATDNDCKQGASSQSQVGMVRPSTDSMPSFVQEPCDGRGMANSKNSASRVLPSIGAFTVQCAKCFKWRLIPSKEQYEEIRQHIIEKPFFCSTTSLWQPGASCDDPPELREDAKFLWAIDKPNIPVAPSGWERLLVIRGEGCSKFADIYYIAPSGKKLRSMPEIERYLSEHPELVNEGFSLSQFSFRIPRALDENYCRKRTVGSSTVMRGSITHKSTPTNHLGVRSEPLKVSYLRKFPADHFESGAEIFDCRQPRVEWPSLNCDENAPLAIEPLRAWNPDNHAMMLGYHAGVALENPANVG